LAKKTPKHLAKDMQTRQNDRVHLMFI